MKVLWLSTFPLHELDDKSIFTQEPKSHPTSWVYNLAPELAKDIENIDLHILTLTPHIYRDTHFVWKGIDLWLMKSGLPFINKGYPKIFRLDIFTNYCFERKRLIKKIEELNPDIVHIHGSEYAYVTLIGKYKKKAVLSIQGVYSDIFKTSKHLGDIVQSKIEIKSIRNGIYFGVRTLYDAGFVQQFNNKAILLTMDEAISLNYFNQTWQLNNDISVLFVGYVIRRKGLHVLISALSEIKKTRPRILLKVIGGSDKGYKIELNKLIRKYNLQQNVFFLGTKNSTFIAEELAKTTIFVLPSFFENSSNSLAEAMVVGTPLIASDVGGVSSMVEDGQNGLLFEAGNEQDLAEKMLNLLDDNELMLKLSKNARERARKRHYPPYVSENTKNAYRKILGL